MKIGKFIVGLVFSLLLLGGGYDGVQAQVEDFYVFEDESYNSSFSGPVTFCVRKDSAAAFASADGKTQPLICDNEGKLYTTSAGGSGGAVTNAGVFAVQEDGAALTAQQAIQTATEAINTKLVTGTVIGDVNSILAAGLLHANSPVTLIDTFSLFDGSGETQIATTNLGASKAYSVPGTGRLVQICVIVSLGTPFAENMSIIFFDADPSVTIEDAALTLAASQNITNIISLRGSDFRDNFATTKINCQTIDEQYVAITYVVFASEGLTTYDDEDIEIRVLYRRKS